MSEPRRRYLVTGVLGAIGAWTARTLVERGATVVGLDLGGSQHRLDIAFEPRTRDGLELVQGDIADLEALERLLAGHGITNVIHLAAMQVPLVRERPALGALVNVVGTVNVLVAAGDAQVIFSSSGGAGYGECPVPATEESPFLPLSPYGIAKKCGEEYLAGWNRIHGTSHVSLRFANVYGERQDSGLEGGVVAIFLERLARSEETVVFGDGDQRRDFVYVGDVLSLIHISEPTRP